jgi:Lrp/AsnC family transcriptional regulator for asnA, asnC and gidA
MIKDGRVKYTKLARDLGVTPAAIKERIDRLIKNKLVKPTILINVQELYPVGAAVGIEADQDTVDSLVKRLSNSPRILRIMRASGNHNLILSLVAEDIASLEAFINNQIRSEAGIKHVEVNITNSSSMYPDFVYLRLVGEKEPMLEKIKKRVKNKV